MNKGVIYFNKGTKCAVRMLVSIFSLRKVYSGDITILTLGQQPQWLLDGAYAMGVHIKQLPESMIDVPALVAKAALWEHTPYDLTMFLDADTVVLKPIDEYFEKIQQYGFCTGEFAGWVTRGPKISSRIRAFSKVCSPEEIEAALDYGKATNTGVFGFTRDAAILPEWKELTRRAKEHDCSRIPDEVACQLLLPKYKHWLAPVEWGVSVKHGYQPPEDETIIVHYHGRKHASEFDRCDHWKQLFWEYYHSEATPDIQKACLDTHGDRRLKRYLKSVHSNITITTGFDRKYFPKFQAHFPLWLKTQGLMEHKIIVFVDGFDLTDPLLDPYRKRVHFYKWDWPAAESQREKMLTAFIHGAAKYVSTKWTLKLDCDTKPTIPVGYGYRFEYPRRCWRAVATAHRWGYTKPGAWLVTLEKWANEHPFFNGTKPIFPETEYPVMLASKRYGHPRFASFMCLQRTDFLKQIAALCPDKLIVPSHDTYLWYCAVRKGHNICRVNIKAQGFKP